MPSSMGLVAFESWIAGLGGNNSTLPIHVVSTGKKGAKYEMLSSHAGK